MEVKVKDLGNDTWLIEEGQGPAAVYSYILAGTKRAVVIDTGFGTVDFEKVIGDIPELENKDIFVLLSHGHGDHIGGTGFWDTAYINPVDFDVYKEAVDSNLLTVFYPEEKMLREHLAVEKLKDIFVLFEDDYFELGGRRLLLIKVPGHTKGCLAFYDEKNCWLFTGDTCCKADVLLNMNHAGSIAEYRQAVLRLSQIDFVTSWPCHHEKPVSKEILFQFVEAANQLILDESKGEKIDHGFGPSRRFSYKDIAIVYKG